MASILRPSWSVVRLYGSGARNLAKDSSVSLRVTCALFAKPGIDPHTRPFLSAIASIVIHTIRISAFSHQIVLSVMDENSFVKVVLIM